MNSRDYQDIAISQTISSLRQLRKHTGTLDGYWCFIEMATGSGKTFVTYKILTYLLEVRERYNRIHSDRPLPPIKISVLSHRIDTTDQLYQDLFIGRNGNPPIGIGDVYDNAGVTIFHSQAPTDLQKKTNLDVEFVFSTFQTAESLEGENIKDSDIIIADDNHVMTPGSTYYKVIKILGDRKKKPFIFGNTATPDNSTRELFGEPLFRYTLPEYLASKYSPSLEYHFISHEGITDVDVEPILGEVEELSREGDMKVRKRKFSSIKDKFDALLSRHETVEELVKDFLSRVVSTEKNIETTLIFCPSQEIADNVAGEINQVFGVQDIALSYHSGNDTNKGLKRLSDEKDPCKILVVVDKMNEGIDAPAVKNIVFWRSTNSSKIFLQQFGRGLRGDKHVKYFDYVGGLSNFVAIYNIYQEYREYSGDEKLDILDTSFVDPGKKFNLMGMNTGTEDHQIDMSMLGLRLARVQYDVMNTRLVEKEEVREMLLNKELSPHNIVSHVEWVKFYKKWNNANADEKGYHLPRTLKGLFTLIDPELGNYASNSERFIRMLLGEKVQERQHTKHYIYDKFEELKLLISRGILPKEAFYSQENWIEWFKNSKKNEIRYPLRKYDEQDEWYNYNRRLREYSQDEILSEVTSTYEGDRSTYYLGGIKIHPDFPWFLYDGYILKSKMDQNVGLSPETIEDFLSGKDTKKHCKPIVTREVFGQLLDTDSEILDIYMTRGLTRTAYEWNRTKGWQLGYRIPHSVKDTIQLLGGDTSCNSTKYLRALIQGNSELARGLLEKPKKTKMRVAGGYEVYDLFHQGVIPRKLLDTYANGTMKESNIMIDAWNQENEGKYGFRLSGELSKHFLENGIWAKEKKFIVAAILSERASREFFLVKRHNIGEIKELLKIQED